MHMICSHHHMFFSRSPIKLAHSHRYACICIFCYNVVVPSFFYAQFIIEADC